MSDLAGTVIAAMRQSPDLCDTHTQMMAPIDYTDRNGLIEITRQIARTQNAEQQRFVCNTLDEDLASTGFFLSVGTAREVCVRI